MTQMTASAPIPPGMESLGRVQTRLGTLRFVDGIPDGATVQTLFDILDLPRRHRGAPAALAQIGATVFGNRVRNEGNRRHGESQS